MSSIFLDWNAWAIEELSQMVSPDDRIEGPLGSLCKKSDKLGDGQWCPVCLRKGKYSWIELRRTCPEIVKGLHD